MANRCRVEISMPAEAIPDVTERRQYLALNMAQQSWRRKYPNGAPFGEEYEKFLTSQPNVASDLYASFGDKDGELWIQPEKLKYYLSKHQFSEVSMVWGFNHGFPWWAQVGFANGEKSCGLLVPKEPEGRGWLVWELDVPEVLNNLKYAIKVHEQFPVNNQAWEWQEVFRSLCELEQIYSWFCKVKLINSDAVATLDWSEVATNTMDYKTIKNNNGPNEIMASIKRIANHTKQLVSGKLSPEKFREIYADKAEYYIPIAEREPFSSERILI